MKTRYKFLTGIATIITPLTILITPQAIAQSSNPIDPKPVTEPLVRDNDALSSASFSAVNQGDMIHNLESECTVGYVDKINRRLYTAKHCFGDGETVYLKNGVRKVGTFHYVKQSETSPGENVGDFAYILLDSAMKAGTNSYSGDSMSQEWRSGDKIYNYSRNLKDTTSGNAKRDSTNPTFPSDPSHMRRNTDPSIPSSQPGDSGGPVWSDNGLVGVIYGHIGTELRFTKLPSTDTLNKIPQGEKYVSSQSTVFNGLSSLSSNGQLSSALSSF